MGFQKNEAMAEALQVSESIVRLKEEGNAAFAAGGCPRFAVKYINLAASLQCGLVETISSGLLCFLSHHVFREWQPKGMEEFVRKVSQQVRPARYGGLDRIVAVLCPSCGCIPSPWRLMHS